MSNIVFYVRALFHESIMPGGEISNKPDVKKLIDIFKSFSKISAEDYRKEIHKIQIKNISNISERIIYNNAEERKDRKYNYTFCVLQDETVEKLKQLNDDDWVIPIDDDDWFSPEIKNLPFEIGSLNCWNTISFCHKKLDQIRVFNHIKNKEIPYRLLQTEEELKTSRGLLSNCQCLPAYIIKELIKLNRHDILQPLLQRHSTVRKLIREDPLDKLNIKEKLFDDVLSIYVRHAANITLFEKVSKFGEEDNFKDSYEEIIKPYKFASYDNIINLPENLQWSIPYLNDLKELNQLL